MELLEYQKLLLLKGKKDERVPLLSFSVLSGNSSFYELFLKYKDTVPDSTFEEEYPDKLGNY